MDLLEVLESGIDDAIIAESLSRARMDPEFLQLLVETTIPIASFNYNKAKNDPKPNVLVLGRWEHPSTKNELVCGINLNYLNDDQKQELMAAVPKILAKDTLKAKYWEGMSIIPGIFKDAYRTYDRKHINAMRLKRIETPEPEIPDKEQQKTEPLPGPQEPTAAPEPQEKKPEGPEKPQAPEAPEKPQKQPELEPEPEKPHKGFIRRTGSAIASLARRIIDKLHRNREKPPKSTPEPTPKKVEVDDLKSIEQRKGPGLRPHSTEAEDLGEIENNARGKTAGHELDQIEKIEKTKELGSIEEIEKNETIQDLDQIEKEHTDEPPSQPLGESLLGQLDSILESYSLPGVDVRWESAEHYIDAHTIDNFFGYHRGLGRTILESTNGTQFLGVYNINEDVLIIDIADDHEQMLESAGWESYETIRFALDGTNVQVMCEDETAYPLAVSLLKSPFGELLREVAQA